MTPRPRVVLGAAVTGPLVAAGGAASVAGVWMLVALARAVWPSDPHVPGATAGVVVPAGSPRSPGDSALAAARGSTPDTLVEAVADLAPFRADRERPQLRYGEPGVEPRVDPAADAMAPVPESVEEIRLVGTVVGGAEGSFAICQLGAEPPRIVRIGQRIGQFRLTGVRPGAATFTSATGSIVTVRVNSGA